MSSLVGRTNFVLKKKTKKRKRVGRAPRALARVTRPMTAPTRTSRRTRSLRRAASRWRRPPCRRRTPGRPRTPSPPPRCRSGGRPRRPRPPRPSPPRRRPATLSRRCERVSSPHPAITYLCNFMFRFKSTIVFIIRR